MFEIWKIMLRTQTTGRTRRRCALTWRGTTIRTVSTLWHVIIVLWEEQRSGPRVYCSSSASPRAPQAAQPAHKPHAHVSHTCLSVYAESLSNCWARLPAALAASSLPPNKRMLTRHSTAGCWDMMCDMMSHWYFHLLTMYSARDSPYKLPGTEFGAATEIVFMISLRMKLRQRNVRCDFYHTQTFYRTLSVCHRSHPVGRDQKRGSNKFGTTVTIHDPSMFNVQSRG